MKFSANNIIKFFFIFLLGFISANIGLYFVYGYEMPFSTGINGSKQAPSDFIGENQIQVFSDKIIIYINDASISRYAPTGSMKPILDENSNGIRIKPESEDGINVGDIITFKRDGYLIVHRVIEKGIDENGYYFITKGDNTNISDGKVRFKDIEYVTIGVLW